jgi:hypothetical protein
MHQETSTPVLEGDRIILKPLTEIFCTQKYLSWLNDPEVYKYLSTGGDFTMEQLVKFLREKSFEGIFFWAIIVKENDNHIGNIKIDKIDKKDLNRLHYLAWKKGIKSLYYCRSKSLQRADKVSISDGVEKHQLEMKLSPVITKEDNKYDECLSCQ